LKPNFKRHIYLFIYLFSSWSEFPSKGWNVRRRRLQVVCKSYWLLGRSTIVKQQQMTQRITD